MRGEGMRGDGFDGSGGLVMQGMIGVRGKVGR